MQMWNKKIKELPYLNYYLSYGIREGKFEDKNSKKLTPFSECYTRNWEKTKCEQAYYYREGSRDSVGNENGELVDRFMSGHAQMKGNYFNSFKNGLFFYYHENNMYSQMGIYNGDYPVGKWTHFYSNGKPKEVIFYNRGETLLMARWDSVSGKQIVVAGNGEYKTFFNNGFIKEKGNYANGKKDGTWFGFYENGKPYYRETFNSGEFLMGESYNSNGSKQVYEHDFEYAQPLNAADYKSLTDLLSENIIYPIQARKLKINCKVSCEVKIDSLGNVTEVTPINKIGFGCEEEAIRVIKKYGNYAPAKLRGRAISDVVLNKVNFEIN